MANTKEKPTEKDVGKKVINNIIDNYQKLEESIVSQLSLCNALHSTTTGSVREDVWLQLFETIVPKKFVIEHSIFIIDSYDHVSREVDLAIIDNNYTPYIFQFGRLKYVPIEAVAAVVECKSTEVKFQEEDKGEGKKESGMTAWCNRIKELNTSRESVARMATGTVVKGKSYNHDKEGACSSAQTATRPIRIFCGYKTKLPDKKLLLIKDFFDFTLLAKEDGTVKTIEISVSDKANLAEWYKELAHYNYHEEKKHVQWTDRELEVIENKSLQDYSLSKLDVTREDKKVSLLSFNFQLNQLLMIINNPMLFPHYAYAELFNGNGQREKTC